MKLAVNGADHAYEYDNADHDSNYHKVMFGSLGYVSSNKVYDKSDYADKYQISEYSGNAAWL